MASTPSASALTAVLRCRGKIWTRNPPTKRPSGAARGLGLDPRSGSTLASAWTLCAGTRLAVACRWARVGDDVSGQEEYKKNNKLRHPELTQSAWNPTPHSARATLARGLRSALLGRETCSTIIPTTEPKAKAAHVCGVLSVHAWTLPRGSLKLSVAEKRSCCWRLIHSCFCVTQLLSRVFLVRLRGRSSGDAQHLAHLQRDARHVDKCTCPRGTASDLDRR